MWATYTAAVLRFGVIPSAVSVSRWQCWLHGCCVISVCLIISHSVSLLCSPRYSPDCWPRLGGELRPSWDNSWVAESEMAALARPGLWRHTRRSLAATINSFKKSQEILKYVQPYRNKTVHASSVNLNPTQLRLYPEDLVCGKITPVNNSVFPASSIIEWEEQ